MLEKLIIYGSIAVALSIYPAIKLRKATALNRYQDRISVLEHKIDVIKITEEDPAKKFVKIDKIKAKITKVKEKADKRMKVRGSNSLNGNNAPLYVVNGTIMEKEEADKINPNDIKKIDVLKDDARKNGFPANNGIKSLSVLY
jgi:hypothetical protein